MVFFSCDGCGEMLKKNQVDAHAYRCRDCASVSCVDCSVSFWGDDYRSHTSCISEAERYEKTVYRGPKKNQVSNRKLTPQEAWMEVINKSLENAPSSLKNYLEQISCLDNVPRKEKPFRNFAGNSLRIRGNTAESIVGAIWKYLCTVREEVQKKKQEKDKTKTKSRDGQSLVEQSNLENDGKENKTNLDKPIETQIHGQGSNGLVENNLQLDRKAIKKFIKKALKKAPKHQLKFKKLQTKVKETLLAKKYLSENTDVKKIFTEVIGENKKEMKMEGKVVILL